MMGTPRHEKIHAFAGKPLVDAATRELIRRIVEDSRALLEALEPYDLGPPVVPEIPTSFIGDVIEGTVLDEALDAASVAERAKRGPHGD